MNQRSDAFLSQLPPPSEGPWISEQMPWTNPSNEGVMRFTGGANRLHTAVYKRKCINFEHIHPPKQHITEEKMAATLNDLHISHDYVAHISNNTIQGTEKCYSQSKKSTEDVMDSEIESPYSLCSSKELEEKLKRAKHITICDEFKNIKNNEPIIPKALLEHYEKPCKALVIWQPPPKIKDLILVNNSTDENKLDSDNTDRNVSSNCNSNIDLNSVTMETDMFNL